MPRADADCVVTTLVEIQGGPDQWRKAVAAFDGLGWACRLPTSKEKRVTRRALEADVSDSCFRWVDVPVAGSSWRAAREASWQIADVGKRAQIVLYGRVFQHAETDRVIQPEWQVHSTNHLSRGAAPSDTLTWEQPIWWLRRGAYETAVRAGLFDLQQRIHSSKGAALLLSQKLNYDTPRSDVGVRPLDGRGRAGVRPQREDALNRGLALFIGPLFAMALLLVLARGTGFVTNATLSFLALACAGVAWWTALTLPMGRTWRSSVFCAVLGTLLAVSYVYGAPGLYGGMTHNTAVGVSALTYYIIGLVLLVRRWHWQGLLAGAFPLIATFAIAALPVTGRILHDAYADELSLSQEETSVSGIWQIASSIKLIWPSLGTTLFLAAGWSILRYFHFVRRNSYFGGLFLTLLLAFSLTSTAQSTLNSPKRAAEKVRQAALQNAIPPKYFGLSPEWVCVAPTVPTNRLNEEGGTLQPADPYISFGVADRYVVLWNHATARPLRIPAEQVRITPEEKPTDKCIPSTRQARNGWQNTGH